MNDSQLIWEAYEGDPRLAQGLDTSWSDTIDGKQVTITMPDVLAYLDENKVPVVKADPKILKDQIIVGLGDKTDIPWEDRWDPEALKASGDMKTYNSIVNANLRFPIILIVGMNGGKPTILDGNHRFARAFFAKEPLLTRTLDLRSAPPTYQHILNPLYATQ